MFDNRSLILLIIYVGYVCTEYKIYTGGWVPVPREQIYNQIHREAEANLIYPTFEPATEDLESIKAFQADINKLNIADVNTVVLDNVNRKVIRPSNRKYETYEKNLTKVDAAESQRKPKHIIYPDLLNSFDAIVVDQKFKQKDEFKDNISDLATVIEDKTTSYSVKEDIDDVNEPEKPKIDTKPTTAIENENYNSTFINILSKYNIKTDDNLKNYDLSRNAKTQTPTPAFQREWIPYRYNNLNHLPVDPLLAVFLSNYGFYIPSLYGMKSNYNNLYGYLASNNIHNNRPFGLYKVFSDTDSWK